MNSAITPFRSEVRESYIYTKGSLLYSPYIMGFTISTRTHSWLKSWWKSLLEKKKQYFLLKYGFATCITAHTMLRYEFLLKLFSTSGTANDEWFPLMSLLFSSLLLPQPQISLSFLLSHLMDSSNWWETAIGWLCCSEALAPRPARCHRGERRWLLTFPWLTQVSVLDPAGSFRRVRSNLKFLAKLV